MKQSYLVIFLLLWNAVAFGQRYVGPVGLQPDYHAPPPSPHFVPAHPHAGKTSMLNNVVPLGRASNMFTHQVTKQNVVYANDSLDLVIFGHRQDVSLFGSPSGKMRYDMSTDGGQSWVTEIGTLNPQHLFSFRFPNLTGFNPDGSSDPLQTKIAYWGVTINGNGTALEGYATGVADVTDDNVNQVATTEDYVFQSLPTFLPGGLIESEPGVFWVVTEASDGGQVPVFHDSTMVYRGTWNAGTRKVDWVFHGGISAPHLMLNGQGLEQKPNIGFSPDGTTGWIAFLGDLVGGRDSVFQPIVIKSTDSGQTWGSPAEINLSQFQHVLDSLARTPGGSGTPTIAFDQDLVVDKNGNPHFVTVVGHGDMYTIDADRWMGLYDITSTDGGATWEARFISPVVNFRAGFGNPLVFIDNYCQASRTEDGEYVFFSWTDTDSALSVDNIAPNLMLAGFRVDDGFRTCNVNLTVGDPIWDGSIITPTMAPTVIVDEDSGRFRMPIVFTQFLLNDPRQQVQFHYLGNDAVFCLNDFQDPASLDLWWQANCNWFGQTCSITAQENPQAASALEMALFPNPARDQATMRISGLEKGPARIRVTDILGKEHRRYDRTFGGTGQLRLDLHLAGLSDGIYIVSVRNEGHHLRRKLVVRGR